MMERDLLKEVNVRGRLKNRESGSWKWASQQRPPERWWREKGKGAKVFSPYSSWFSFYPLPNL